MVGGWYVAASPGMRGGHKYGKAVEDGRAVRQCQTRMDGAMFLSSAKDNIL